MKQVASKNQSYYWRCKSKTHKHYNYSHRWIEWKVYTKVIKMPSWKAWVKRQSGLIKSGGSASAFKVMSVSWYNATWPNLSNYIYVKPCKKLIFASIM
jgi:hypothetical protein